MHKETLNIINEIICTYIKETKKKDKEKDKDKNIIIDKKSM